MTIDKIIDTTLLGVRNARSRTNIKNQITSITQYTYICVCNGKTLLESKKKLVVF